MATAWARCLHSATGTKATFGYRSSIFEGNPHIAKEGEKGALLPHRPGQRPYILGQYKDRFIFNPSHRAIPGNIYLAEAERRIARAARPGYILVEPHVKGKVSSNNKDWGWQKWCDLVRGRLDVVQLDYGKPILPGAEPLPCESFRQACAYVEQARLFVGTDGGLHHAAAALNTPAVVIWGGYSSPDILGYDKHVNIWHGNGPCGILRPCSHCQDEMSRISVDEVARAIEGELSARVSEKEDARANQAKSCGPVSLGG